MERTKYPADLARAVHSEIKRNYAAPSLQVLISLFETMYFASIKTEEAEPVIFNMIGGYLDDEHIPVDLWNGLHMKGFGFVEMASKAEGQSAIDGLNGKELKGKALNVNEARPRTESRGSGGGYGGGRGYGGGKGGYGGGRGGQGGGRGGQGGGRGEQGGGRGRGRN